MDLIPGVALQSIFLKTHPQKIPKITQIDKKNEHMKNEHMKKN